MKNPEPSIRVNVDITNPGQFFACCGLLELADRLWPGAEGWFASGGSEFCIACEGTLIELLRVLTTSIPTVSERDEMNGIEVPPFIAPLHFVFNIDTATEGRGDRVITALGKGYSPIDAACLVF